MAVRKYATLSRIDTVEPPTQRLQAKPLHAREQHAIYSAGVGVFVYGSVYVCMCVCVDSMVYARCVCAFSSLFFSHSLSLSLSLSLARACARVRSVSAYCAGMLVYTLHARVYMHDVFACTRLYAHEVGIGIC